MLANGGLFSVTNTLLFILSKSAALKPKLVITYVFVAKPSSLCSADAGWGVACVTATAFPVPAPGGNRSRQQGWGISCSLDAASAFQTHTSVLSVICKINKNGVPARHREAKLYVTSRSQIIASAAQLATEASVKQFLLNEA